MVKKEPALSPDKYPLAEAVRILESGDASRSTPAKHAPTVPALSGSAPPSPISSEVPRSFEAKHDVALNATGSEAVLLSREWTESRNVPVPGKDGRVVYAYGGGLPIVVAGTGLYLRALLEGLFPGPQRSEELRRRLRDRARQEGPGYLHKLLGRLDSAAGKKIHANDAPKLIRAIEVCLGSRQKMTELWKQGREPLQGFRILRLGLNPERAALYQRINQRANRMFESGLVEETAGLLEKYGDTAQALSSLGYRQADQLVRGQIDHARGISQAQQAHRNYAKRQMTWFRREPEVVWLAGFGDDPEIQLAAVAQVQDALEGRSSTSKACPSTRAQNALARDDKE